MLISQLILICLLLSLVSSQCGESCMTCVNSTTCTACISQNNLILRNDSFGCVPCSARCEKCTSENSTKQCTSCSTGYFSDPLTSTCSLCLQSNCNQCNPYSPSECTACQTSYYLEQATSTCKFCNDSYPNSKTCRQNFITACQDGYFTANGQTCSKCSVNSSCKVCSSSTLCTQCFDGFYLATGSKCNSCDSSCKTCNSNTTCVTCPKGYRLNSSSKCQPCSTSNCTSCTIQDICQQCAPNYYLDSQTKTCILLPSNKTVINCIKYVNNYNFSVSSNYGQTQILCQGCSNGTYLSGDTNSCQSCSLLCGTCSGMYRSSKCLACNQVFGRMIDSTNGICAPSLFTSDSNQVFYLNNRNNPDNYSRTGNLITFPQSPTRCPGGTLASQISINISSAIGYSYTIYTKILFYTISQSPYYLNVKLNSAQVYQQRLPDPNTSSFTTMQVCNNITVANFSFTFSLSQLSSTNQSFINQNMSNVLSFYFPSSENVILDVKQLIILVKQCHSTCLSCLFYENCQICKNTNQFLQQQKCVDSCDSGYFLNEVGRQCLLSCPQGMYNDFKSITWSCKTCNSSCSICSDASICSSCKNGFFLFESLCLSTCPSQYFPNSIFNRCEKCTSPCDQCLSIRQCTSCEIGFLFSGNNTCISQCPTTYYGDLQTMECLKCSSPCYTCTSQAQCLTCMPSNNLTYFKSQCISNCPVQYYTLMNQQNQLSCQLCSFPCLQCVNTSSTCTKCKAGYLLDLNSTCVSSCPDQYFSSQTYMKCIACSSPCKNCKDSQKLCTSCLQNYFYDENENSCLLKCNTGFYPNNTAFTCTSCPSECKSCLNSTLCTSCNSNYYLTNNICLQNCPDGYFKDLSNNENICFSCSQNCLTCFGSSDYCLTCYNDFFLLPNNTCNSLCKVTQLTPGCNPCEYPCYSCQNTVSNCTLCQNGFYLSSSTNECVSECYIGYYKVIQKGFGICQACSTPCTDCQSESICHSCSSINSTKYYLQTQTANKIVCVVNCSSFEYKNQEQKICMECISPCLTCLNLTYCTSCENGILINGSCVSQNDGCPISTYQTQKSMSINGTQNSTIKICLSCPQNCSSCESLSVCTACRQNYYLFGNTCVDFCPSGLAPIKNLRQCIFCLYPCAQCSGSSLYCKKCSQMKLNSSSVFCPSQRKLGTQCIKYFLLDGECLTDCPPITYSIGDQCVACLSPCVTCASAYACTSCIQNYYMLENKCYSTCPLGYYGENQTIQCQKCQYPCQTCSSISFCLTCIEGYLYESRCLITESCPVGYFQSFNKTLGNICQQCNSTCIACEDSKSYCLQCFSQSLFQGQCYAKCPNGYYSKKKSSQFVSNLSVLSCEKCQPQCLTCASSDQCLNCVFPYLLLSQQCVDRCPPNYMQRISTFEFSSEVFYSVSSCSICQSPCESCFLDETLCQTCIDNYYMYNEKCFLICPNGTYLNNLTSSCKQCPFPCKSCVQQNDDILCTECIKGYYVQNNLCIDKCRQTFIDVNEEKCVTNCSGYFMVEDINTKVQFCAKQCKLPYLKSLSNDSCVTSCSSGQYVNAQNQCKQLNAQILSLIPEIKCHMYINSNGILVFYMQMTRSVDFVGSIQLQSSIKIIVSNYILQSQFQTTRLLQSNQNSSSSIPFQVSQKSSQFIMIELYPNNSIIYPGSVEVLFNENSHLYIVDKISRLPLTSSSYKVELNETQEYQAYDYGLVNNRFGYVGEVVMDFVFILSFGLIIFNRYAKIYHFLTFAQSIFMLICLDISVPPNLYRFLQGFKYAHFYQIGDWIDTIDPNERYTDFSNKGFSRIESIFGDINFLRISGHLICLYFIILAILLILYVTKFLPHYPNEHYLKVKELVSKKLSHIKWSHITDVFISTFMLILASFFIQTVDYSVRRTQQAVGIVLSYFFMIIFLTYGIYFCVKTYKMTKLSLTEPDKFLKKEYPQRQEYMPFFEGITTPQNSYKNYLLVMRIVVYGVLAGLLWEYENFCLSIWIIFQICYAVIYICLKPFALDTQNYLYGVVGLIHSLSMSLIIAVNQYKGSPTDVKASSTYENTQSLLLTKSTLGYIIIILVVICLIILLIQMIVSIIRGSFVPKKLNAEQQNYQKVKQKSPNSIMKAAQVPSKILFEQKIQLTGYTLNKSPSKASKRSKRPKTQQITSKED